LGVACLITDQTEVAKIQKQSGVTIPLVNAQDSNSLGLIQRAASNYDTMVGIFKDTAAKSASQRGFFGPRNLTMSALQTDPQLAASVADTAASLEAAAAQMTGLRGLRMSQDMVQKLQNAAPQPTDTLATIRQKQILTHTLLENAAHSILAR